LSRPEITDRSPGARLGGDSRNLRPAQSQRRTLGLAITLQALISAGDGLAMIALANRVFQSSHASWAVAAVFLAVTVPITALAPVAGVVLDRLPTRPVLVTAALLEALVALALSRVAGVGATLGLSVGFGICAAVLQPGLGAIVPRIAGHQGVTKANGYLQAATWAGFTAGPLLAGVLATAGGSGLALLADAALYALGAVGLYLLRPVPRESAGGAGASQERIPLGTQMKAGFSYLRADRDAGMLVLIVGVVIAFANMAVVAEVVFAEQVLRSGPGGYSILVAGFTGGMVVGTLAGGRLPRRWLLVAALAGTIATGIGVGLAGAAVVLWQATAAYGFGGLASGVEGVATRSFLNHRAPPEVAGRVFALYSGVLFGAASAGMAVAAGLLTALGARGVLAVAGGGGILAGAAGSAVYARRVIRGRRPHPPPRRPRPPADAGQAR
jgi:MFS family permease